MASGGHSLAQQKQGVESRLKGLINVDLKELCKAYHTPVSGTKATLQRRCIAGKSSLWGARGAWEFWDCVVGGGEAVASLVARSFLGWRCCDWQIMFLQLGEYCACESAAR